MAALIVPLQLIRNAVDQSDRLGMPESRADVIARVLNDLRTIRHPATVAIYSLADYQQIGAAPAQGGAA